MKKHISGRRGDQKSWSMVAKIDLVLIVVTVGVLLFLVGYSRPLVIAPLDNFETTDRDVLFEFERGDVLLIDDNSDFTTPDEYRISEGDTVKLMPGTWYWKVNGVLGSEIRTLTVKSKVELKLVETEEGVSVVNAGNVGLNVEVYDDDELIEKKRLGVGEQSGEGDKFVGEYDE
jgi:hypothetical protein